jgi:hypothetical protein
VNGKGSARRPCRTSPEEEHLRWALAAGTITFAQFEQRYRELLHEGKITRDGKVVKHTRDE